MDEQTPWPAWVIRAIASDDPDTFEEAIWSVGGSPPYGGVSYEEAGVVYNLLESYLGSGTASAEAYDAALRGVGGSEQRRLVIEAFRAHDEITSNSEAYSVEEARAGTTLAEQLDDDGLRALFLSYEALALAREGSFSEAAQVGRRSLELYLELADDDEAYAQRVSQNATNLVSLTANAGDLEGARRLLDRLAGVMDPEYVQMLSRSLQ